MVRHSTKMKNNFFSIFELILCQKLGTYIVKKTPKNYRSRSSSLGATVISAKAVFCQNQDFPSFLVALCSKKCHLGQHNEACTSPYNSVHFKFIMSMYPIYVGKKWHMFQAGPNCRGECSAGNSNHENEHNPDLSAFLTLLLHFFISLQLRCTPLKEIILSLNFTLYLDIFGAKIQISSSFVY